MFQKREKFWDFENFAKKLGALGFKKLSRKKIENMTMCEL